MQLREIIPNIFRQATADLIPLPEVFQFINLSERVRILSYNQWKHRSLLKYLLEKKEINSIVIAAGLLHCSTDILRDDNHPNQKKCNLLISMLQVVLQSQTTLPQGKLYIKLRQFFQMCRSIEGVQLLSRLDGNQITQLCCENMNITRTQFIKILSYLVHEEIAIPKILCSITVVDNKIELIIDQKLGAFIRGLENIETLIIQEPLVLCDESLVERQLNLIYKQRLQYNEELLGLMLNEQVISNLLLLRNFKCGKYSQFILQYMYYLANQPQYILVQWMQNLLQNWRLLILRKLALIQLNFLIEQSVQIPQLIKFLELRENKLSLVLNQDLFSYLSSLDILIDIISNLKIEQILIQSKLSIQLFSEYQFHILPLYDQLTFDEQLLISIILDRIYSDKVVICPKLIQVFKSSQVQLLIEEVLKNLNSPQLQQLISLYDYVKSQGFTQLVSNTYNKSTEQNRKDIFLIISELVHFGIPFVSILNHIKINPPTKLILMLSGKLNEDLDKIQYDTPRKLIKCQKEDIQYNEQDILIKMIELIENKKNVIQTELQMTFKMPRTQQLVQDAREIKEVYKLLKKLERFVYKLNNNNDEIIIVQ